jgi:MinD superfamily P-loop ATPase
MSLEATAALLGHKSMRMTIVYAKIASRTVADGYFKVSEKVEARYEPKELPATSEEPRCASCEQRCTSGCSATAIGARPVGLDCHFESICESCAYLQTTVEFRPVLERQRDDTVDKGQVGREKVFDGLLTRLDAQAS